MPTVYLIVCELGMTAWAGALAGFFMLLGELSKNSFYVDRNAFFKNALCPASFLYLSEKYRTLNGVVTISDTAFLAQSRYILLESMMMWFAFMAVLSVLKMRRYRLVVCLVH